MKKAIIVGASGMIGSLILKHCLASDEISGVTSLVRKKSGISHPKLNEKVTNNFKNLSELSNEFQAVDMAFFCLGVYTGQVPDEKFKEITVDYGIAFTQALRSGSPKAKLCFLSGAGADRTERSSASFARYKGMVENEISSMNLAFYAFRPGYIYPVERRKEPNLMYRILRMAYPLMQLLGSDGSIKSTELAYAMFNVGIHGADREILENRAILCYAK